MDRMNPHGLPLVFGYARRDGDGVGPLPFGDGGGRFFVWFKIGDVSVLGTPAVWNWDSRVDGAAAGGGCVFGAAVFISNMPFYPVPFVSSVLGRPAVRNAALWVRAEGWDGFIQGADGAKSAGRFRRHLLMRERLPLAFVLPVSDKAAKTALPFGFSPDVGYLFFRGLDGGFVGAARVSSSILDVRRASAGNGLSVGTVRVGNAAVQLRPRRFLTLTEFAEPRALNRNTHIFPVFRGEALFGGEAAVFNRLRRVGTGKEPFVSLRFGKADLSHFLRRVIVRHDDRDGYGDFSAVGKVARIGFFRRFVAPETIGFRRRQFSRNHRVLDGSRRTLAAEGWDSARYLSRIVPDAQTVYATGWGVVYGLPWVSLFRRYIRVGGVNPPEVRFADVVRNVVRFVVLPEDEEGQISPLVFGSRVGVENRNRALKPNWFVSGRFGYTLFAADARVVGGMDGVAALGWGGTLVTHGVQNIAPDGTDGALVPVYVSVWTNGQVAEVAPWSDGAVSAVASVWNSRRYLRRITGISGDGWGVPMVAFALRYVLQDNGTLSFAIAPPDMRMPSVRLGRRFVSFAGADMQGFGRVETAVRRNIVRPRWRYLDNGRSFGVLYLRNRNIGLRLWGRDFSSVSDGALVENRVRYIPIGSFGSYALGRNVLLAFRVRYIRVGGFELLRIPAMRHDVWTDSTPPFGTKSIVLDSVLSADGALEHEGNGWNSNEYAWGIPGIIDMSVRDAGFDSPRYGEPMVFNNGVVVRQGVAIQGFGTHAFTFKNRAVSLTGGIFREGYGFHDFAPRTVWVMYAPPKQASANHYRRNAGGYRAPLEGIAVGIPALAFGGVIFQKDAYPQWYGQKFSDHHRLENARKDVRARGFRHFRMGWHTVYPYPQDIVMFSQDDVWADYMVFGRCAVGFPWEYDGNLYPRGVAAENFAWDKSNRVSNRNQDVHGRGADMLEMGKRRWNDTPFMWQGLRVGERIPTAIGGGDMMRFGSFGEVSHRDRTVEPEGLDSFVSEADIRRFDDRLIVYRVSDAPPDNRVKHRVKYGGFEQVVFVQAVGFSPFGRHEVGNKVQFIRPDGYSDQFRKGASVWQR